MTLVTSTPPPSCVSLTQDSVTLVLGEEPIQLNSFRSIGASLNAPTVRDNLVDPLTWQSGDDQRIMTTSATTGGICRGPGLKRRLRTRGLIDGVQ
jgi:hypothetical protein